MSAGIFTPSKSQALAKVKILEKVAANPLVSAETVSVAELCRYAGTRSVEKWMAIDGFREWLLDAGQDKAKLSAYADKAIETLYKILDSPIDPKLGVTASAQVSAASKILEAAGLIKGKEVSDKKDNVKEMTTEELRKRASELLGDNYAN